MATLQKHIVAFTLQAWGHTRPLIHLSARLVKLRPVTVTFLTTNTFFERVGIELARSFGPGDEEYATHIRVVSIGDIPFLEMDEDDVHFKSAWKALISQEELVCKRTSARYADLPKPQAIIIDFFAVESFNTIKALSGNTVKVYGWEPGLVYAIFYLFGPEHLGGKGNIRVKAEEEARRTGRSYNEVVVELAFNVESKVVRIPSMAPMYDHEYYPQEFSFPEELGTRVFPLVYENLERMDGLILFTPESYEPEAIIATRAWLAETGRKAYTCGPLLPSASKATASTNEKRLSQDAREIQDFLDNTLKNSGEKSLLYISFGSIFWPAKSPEKLWAFIDVIYDLNIPFILSHASPVAIVPDEVKEKVNVYGKGLISPWTPQQLILDHPATGWFVAHGGHNGITEAISAGVPQIVWPFGGDQTLNAVLITDYHKTGYELLEVRTGHGLKPIYRTGYTPVGTIEAVKAEARDVLTKAFGEDGKQKRKNMEVLRKSVTSEWEEGGSSKRDMTAFLEDI